MKIETLNTADIRPSSFNPRITLEKGSREYEAIAASIREFGFVEPLVVNSHNMCCLGGHQRLSVLKDMGVDTVSCVIVEEPDQAREKALCVALNRIKGDWDMDMLTALLQDEAVFSLPTGFEEGEVDLERMLEDGVDTFVEIGPGRTLSGFLKKINTEVSVYHISSWEDMERAAGELC